MGNDHNEWDCEELAYLFLNDRDRFPGGIRVVTVGVELDVYRGLRLRRFGQQGPRPTGDNIASEEVPLKEYQIDGVRVMAGYSSALKTLVIGVAE